MCQLNSSHICPYFLRLLDTFTEKIKRETERTMFAKKKSLQKHTAVHHLLPQAGYLITSEKNQRRFQGAPLECTNYISFLKKKEKNWWALRRCKHISRGHLLQEFFKIPDGILMSEFLNNSDQRNQMALELFHNSFIIPLHCAPLTKF